VQPKQTLNQGFTKQHCLVDGWLHNKHFMHTPNDLSKTWGVMEDGMKGPKSTGQHILP
jgi:hypothetical protein